MRNVEGCKKSCYVHRHFILLNVCDLSLFTYYQYQHFRQAALSCKLQAGINVNKNGPKANVHFASRHSWGSIENTKPDPKT